MKQKIWRMTREDFDKEESKYMGSLLLGALIAIPFPVFIVWIQRRQGVISELGFTVTLEVITAVILGIMMMMVATFRIRRVRRAGHTIYALNEEGQLFVFRLTSPALLKLTGLTLTGGRSAKEQKMDYQTLLKMGEKIKEKHYIEDFLRLNVPYTYGGSVQKVVSFQKSRNFAQAACRILNVDGQQQEIRLEIPDAYPEYETLTGVLEELYKR